MSKHFWHIIVPTNVLTLLALIYLIVSGEWGWMWATLAGYVVIHGFGVSIGLHRFCSHESFLVGPFRKFYLIYLSALAGAGSPIWWAGAHRKMHHGSTDKPGDLHSPRDGKWWSYLGWQMNPPAASARAMRYAPKWLRDDRTARFIHKHYTLFIWSTIVAGALLSWQMALFFLVVPQCLSAHVMNTVNLVGHLPRFGYRNFDTQDDSSNNWLLGIISFGEGFHNNHHRFPASYTNSRRFGEFDISSWLIRLLRPHELRG